MKFLSIALTGLVALEHIWFLVLEMFLWQQPIGMNTFSITPEFAEATAMLAANQGLYNGFLAAGLVWALLAKRVDLKIFFLSCVVIAGIFGGLTVGISIMYIQGLPALLALILVYLSAKKLEALDKT